MILRTVLIYLEKDEKYLMLYRNKKKNDYNKNKWLGVGGKIEENETSLEAVIRETKEETNLDLNSCTYRGKIRFFFDDLEEIMDVYHSTDFGGKMKECNEGDLKYVLKKEVFTLDLWPSDYLFLDVLMHTDEIFDFEFIYKNGRLIQMTRRD